MEEEDDVKYSKPFIKEDEYDREWLMQEKKRMKEMRRNLFKKNNRNKF